MNPFVAFMASRNGRILRIVLGAVMVLLGFFVLEATAGTIVLIIGLVPLLAGIFDFCVFAPLFGAPLSGPKIRGEK
jgi:hypothetical protein